MYDTVVMREAKADGLVSSRGITSWRVMTVARFFCWGRWSRWIAWRWLRRFPSECHGRGQRELDVGAKVDSTP